ncbi:MAG: hypothetical protein Aurels2KO_20940 [Aureliella sp.]
MKGRPIVRAAYLALKLLILVSCIGQTSLAVDEFGDIVKLNKLPSTPREVSSAFRRSRSEACEIIPKGESIQIRSFKSTLTSRDVARAKKQRLIPASRRSILTVGLRIDPADQRELPIVSRGSIVDYLETNYVDIQVRVRKDLLDRKLYYHHRPLAVTAQYRGSKLTQSFEPIVSGSIREFHSLGIFAEPGKRFYDPEELRTLVLLFRTPMLESGSSLERDSYEFAFVHGVENSDGDELVPHVFVTTEDRTKLVYLARQSRRPTSPTRCSIVGSIVVTDFDSSGIYPRKSATRTYRIDARAEFSTTSLDSFCKSESLSGGFTQNVPAVLQGIIDRKISPEN